MYRQSFDETDSPTRPRMPTDVSSELYNPRKQKTPDIFQNELARKLKERKKLGLAADITSDETDEDDNIGNFDSKKFMKTRPQSAKKRADRSPEWQPNQSDSLRHSGGGMFSSKQHHQTYDDEEDREVASLGGTQHAGGFPSVGKKPSPRDSLSHDSGLHGRRTPTGKHTPVNESNTLSNEDRIFGVNTLPDEKSNKGSFFRRKGSATTAQDLMNQGDSNENKQWQPPSFSKPPTEQRDLHNRTPSPVSSRGRKTPSSLDPISESGTPRDARGETQARPRLRRQGSTSSDKQSPRTLSVESSPRSDKPTPRPRQTGDKESPRSRTTPTVDLFGKPRRIMDDEEPEPAIKPKPRRQGSSEMTKTASSGRKTPTDKDGGRKTPTFLKSDKGNKPRDRSAPDEQKTPSEESSKPKEEKSSNQTSLLSYLTGEVDGIEAAPAPRARRASKQSQSKENLARENSRESLKRQDSRESVKRPDSRESLKRQESRESLPRQHSRESVVDTNGMISLQQQPKPSADDSSVCEELTREPKSQTAKAQKQSKSNKIQRSDRKEADDAICEVADAQMSYIEPDEKQRQKSATKDKKIPKHRPQPRYPTMPGQSTEETVKDFNDTVSIRQAVYEEWYRERMKEAKRKALEQKKKEKEEEEERKRKLKEKLEGGDIAFQSWAEKKKERLRKEAQKKREEERKKKEKEEQDRKDKIKDMEKTFQTWKEKKDQLLKEREKEKIREQREKEEREAIERRNKEKKNTTAFVSWKNKKDPDLIEKVVKEKKLKETLKTREREEREKKEREAMKKYNRWLKEKEEREKEERYRRKLLERELEERPAWSPPNRTVPFGR